MAVSEPMRGVGFEAAALVEDGFAGAFVDTGEEGADHDGAGTSGDGLGNFTGVLDAPSAMTERCSCWRAARQ